MAIPVVGIDLGYQSCYIGVARGGGIETIANECSERRTPTCVSFGNNSRCVGAAAVQQMVSNFRNTFWGFTRLIGRSYDDPIVQAELNYLPYRLCPLSDGKVGIQVDYLGETQTLSVEQMVGIMLTRLKQITEDNLQTKMVDCVISVPTHFTDIERRAMLDAASIAGLNCVRLLNETTAVGLAYGFFKKDLPEPEKPPRHVAFVDVGHSGLKASIVAFNDKKMKVLATASDPGLGGRDFDRCIFDHLVKEFGERYRLNVLSSKKACLRLMTECEKLKKLMSANSTSLPLNIECFMEDKDVSAKMSRDELENLAAPLLTRFDACLRKLLTESRLQANDLFAVEIIGGGTRMPAIKKIVKDIFGQEPSTTLNADEAVARGCTLQSAIFSPALKVQNFSITDTQPYAVQLRWQDPNSGAMDVMEVFPTWHQIPFSRQITFYRKEPFWLEAVYCNPDSVPHSNKMIGRFTVKNVKPTAEGEAMKVMVKLRINLHGIFSVSQAHYVEKYDVQEEVVVEKPPAEKKVVNGTESSGSGEPEDSAGNATEPMDTSEPPPEVANDKVPEKDSPPAKTTKLVTKQKKVELPIDAQVFQLSRAMLLDYTEKENQMIMQDKLERERSNAKNAVEEYAYENREKIYDQFSEFLTEQEKETTIKILDEATDWLYDEGDDVAKQVYIDKLQSLRDVCSKFHTRYNEAQERPRAEEEMGRSVMRVSKALESYVAGEEQYMHIEKSEMEKVQKSLVEIQKWMNEQLNLQRKLKLTDDPVLLASVIREKVKKFESETNSILNKPKPKEKPPKDAGKENNSAAPDAPTEPDAKEEAKAASKEDMDLD